MPRRGSDSDRGPVGGWLPDGDTGRSGYAFTSRDMDLRAYQRGVSVDFPRSGKPTDNAFILRRGILPRTVSRSLLTFIRAICIAFPAQSRDQA